jgi:NADP-reducing hydrogenase subunit HndB
MPTVKSLEDLLRIRAEASRKRERIKQSGSTEIIIEMGTTGIATGARDTMQAILDFIESHQLSGMIVHQTGSIGLDSLEPIVQIVLAGQPKVTYGKVSVDRVKRILEEHVVNGQIVEEYVIEG